MSFGFDRQPKVMIGDSQILNAYLYNNDGETLIPQSDITGVTFTVLVPGDDPADPTLDHIAGTVIDNGQGQFQVDGWVNAIQGQYKSYAQFTYSEGTLNGLLKSVVTDYDVFDPFVRAEPSPADPAIDQCWMKLEDCFDSEIGGPWLRDMTLAVFDKSKVNGFIPEALLDINQQMPLTTFDVNTFPYGQADGTALFGEALLCATIRHLMRSYTEQPDVTGAPVGFLDRRRYQQAWKSIYDIEMERFKYWLNRWKLSTYDLSGSAMLIHNKAGRMLPAPMRSRYAGRGFGV
jgi:hypothetical protein